MIKYNGPDIKACKNQLAETFRKDVFVNPRRNSKPKRAIRFDF